MRSILEKFAGAEAQAYSAIAHLSNLNDKGSI